MLKADSKTGIGSGLVAAALVKTTIMLIGLLIVEACVPCLYGQSLFGHNLIGNNNAEQGAGSTSGNEVFVVPAWTSAGGFTVAQYSTTSVFGDFPGFLDLGPSDRGTNLFTGGPTNRYSRAIQSIDVSTSAPEIDFGQVTFVLSGFFGGYREQDDNAKMTVVFRDSTAQSLGTAWVGQVLASERLQQTGLLFRSTNGAVPLGTRYVEVILEMTRTAGSYNDGCADSLSFELLQPRSPKLETRLVIPASLGRHVMATIYIEYANIGDTPMPAPLLVLRSSDPDGSDKPVLTLDQSRIMQNFWSAGLPPGVGNEVFVLAQGDQPGVLNPGERVQVPVYYLGMQRPWDLTDNQVELEIRSWTTDDTSVIDWTTRKSTLRPPTLDADTWDVVYDNLTSALPKTGDYVEMLIENAQYLGGLGQRVVNVRDLWNFEVQQAYGYSPLPVLDSAVDSSVSAPGVSLELIRRFSSNLRARHSAGPFGRGWYCPWQSHLEFEQRGDIVRLVGESGSARNFARDTRNGSYFSDAGDASQLTTGGGGAYELRDSNGTVTRFRADGKIESVQDRNSNRVTAGYNGQNRLASLTHSSGGLISLEYNGDGLVSGVTNSAGRSLTYAYDVNGAYLTSVTTDDGKVAVYTYEIAGTLAQRHALTSVTRAGVTRHYTFDTHGRLDETHLASGEQAIDFGYDGAGGVTTTDADGTTSLFYDHRGLLVKTTDPLGHITTSEFNNDLRLSRLVLPTGESRSFTWCNCGSPTSVTDELGQTTRFSYQNPFKRMTNFTDARGNTTQYAYDEQGNLLTTIFPDNSIERLQNYTVSGLPQTEINRRQQAIAYTYTAAGQVDRQTFADGSFADFDYDVRGNLTNAIEHPLFGSDKVTAYLYEPSSQGDRLRKVIYPNARWVEYFYDALGRREKMTDSAGGDTRYQYDVAGRLWKLRDSSEAVLAEYLYTPSGRLRRINKGNGTYTTCGYDAAGQILYLNNHAPNGTTNSRFDYTYDSRGRRRTMSTVDGEWSYEYDATGQLIHAVFVSSNAQIPHQDLRYNYDALGNRTSTTLNGVATTYAANLLNQYSSVGGTNYQYDADGNLTFDGVRNYRYDVKNRLIRVTGPGEVTQYEYDAFGSRAATLLNGQRTEYLLDPTGLINVIAEHDGVGSFVARLVHGLGLVNRSSVANSPRYFDFDALGSTAGVTDPAGAIVNSYSLQPFGHILTEIESVENSFEFVGQYGVESSSTLYMRARHYSAFLGRFLTADPLGIEADFNTYRYAGNAPLTFIDPLGLESATAKLVGPILLGIGVDIVGGISTGQSSDIPGTILGNLASIPGMPSGGAFISFAADPNNALNMVNGIRGIQRSGSCGTINAGAAAQLAELGFSGCKPPPPPSPPSGGGGPGNPGSGGGAGIAASFDPNEKIGPVGFGPHSWVLANTVLPYRINFENLGAGSRDANGNPFPSVATAPAQRVTITDQLQTDLDWTTFQITELGFGDILVPVSARQSHFIGNVSMNYNNKTFNVELEVGIDLATGRVHATFQSIDPATSLPPDVLTGFLPPEDGTGRGKGHITYLVHSKTNLPTGTQIRNVAQIRFDVNGVITTDQVDPQNPALGIDTNKQARVTIDSGAPTSSVTALAAESGRAFVVQWSGADDALGSGIASYDVFVSTNGGMFVPWFSNVTERSAVFIGDLAKTYAFYTISRDNVGNVELPPATPDAQTIVITNAPLIVGVTSQLADVGGSLVISNQVQGFPATNFFWSLAGRIPSGATVNPTNGVLRWTPACSQGSTTNTVTVWATDRARTNISDAIGITVAVKECVAPTLGRLVLRTGDTGRLPINLITSVELTNLVTLVSFPTNRFINLGVEALATQICLATIATTNAFPLPGGEGQSESERYFITLTTCTNQSLIGTQQVAWLVLTAVTNQPSAFVPVKIGPSIGNQPDGSFTTNYVTQIGTVIVVGEEPLLESVRSTNGLVQLILYSQPGITNNLQSTTTLAATGAWTEWQRIVPTNILQNLAPLPPTNRVMIFRAVRP